MPLCCTFATALSLSVTFAFLFTLSFSLWRTLSFVLLSGMDLSHVLLSFYLTRKLYFVVCLFQLRLFCTLCHHRCCCDSCCRSCISHMNRVFLLYFINLFFFALALIIRLPCYCLRCLLSISLRDVILLVVCCALRLMFLVLALLCAARLHRSSLLFALACFLRSCAVRLHCDRWFIIARSFAFACFVRSFAALLRCDRCFIVAYLFPFARCPFLCALFIACLLCSCCPAIIRTHMLRVCARYLYLLLVVVATRRVLQLLLLLLLPTLHVSCFLSCAGRS